MLSQENFQGVQFLGDAFYVVESIHPNYDLAAPKALFERFESSLNSVSSQTVDELHWFDSDRVRADLSVSSLNNIPLGMVSNPRIRVQEDKKWRA